MEAVTRKTRTMTTNLYSDIPLSNCCDLNTFPKRIFWGLALLDHESGICMDGTRTSIKEEEESFLACSHCCLCQGWENALEGPLWDFQSPSSLILRPATPRTLNSKSPLFISCAAHLFCHRNSNELKIALENVFLHTDKNFPAYFKWSIFVVVVLLLVIINT